MNRTRTALIGFAAAADLALTGCGTNTPTAAPHHAAAPALAAPAATSTVTPAPSTSTPTPAPSTAPPVDPTATPPPRPTVPVTHSQTPEAAPATHAPQPAAVAPLPQPTDAPPAPTEVPVIHPPAPAPAPAPAAPRPVAVPVVQAPPPPPPPAPAISSWSGIYDAFVASHPGPTYRVWDTGNFGNTTTNGAGTVVTVSIAPRAPTNILQSVLLHEYGHFRQNHAYGPGLGYAVRAVGSQNLDHAADCWAAAHGASWLNYGCTRTPAVQGILARMGG